MNTELLKTPAISPELFLSEIEIVAEAFELRKQAITQAESITTVTDEFEATQAASAMKQLAELEKQIESSRKMAKDPALQLGKRIDSTAKEFVESIKVEKMRMSRILGEYQIAERKKKEAAERAAREAERQAIVAAEMKEKERLAKELDGRTGTLNEDVEKIAEDTQKEIVGIRQEVAQKHGAISGIKVRKKVCFEVEDVAALQKARPDLFSPDESKIRAALKLTQSIPGLKIWEETKAY